MTETHSWTGEWYYIDDSNFALGKTLLLILLFVLLRYASSAKVRMFYTRRRMDRKTVIVTGSNSGIGKETALYLARLGARVILACRNTTAAEKVKEQIIAETSNENVVVRELDLSSFESIREFARKINVTENRLDVLIHNAGYANTFKKAVSEDGIEMTMATNHYGPFLLTHLLIDLLKRTESSRIVVVASSLYCFAKLTLDNLNPLNSLPVYLYYVSKNANIHFTLELAKRLQGTGVSVNCLHPGLVKTNIWESAPFPLSLGLLPVKFFFKTPVQGCQTSVFCAVSEELDGVSGKYYSDNREVQLAPRMTNEEFNLKFWNESAKLVKLTDADPKI